MKKIVIVGGGAGGLELATLLGKNLANLKKPKSHLLIKTPITFGNHCYMKLQQGH